MASSRVRAAFLFVEKNIVNRMVRFGLARRLTPGALALLETTGRRSGTVRHTPVGNGLIGDTFWLVAERGQQADYVHNIRANPRVRVMVNGHWHSGTATIMPDDDTYARLDKLGRHLGRTRRLDAALLRTSAKILGTTPVTVRIDLTNNQGTEPTGAS